MQNNCAREKVKKSRATVTLMITQNVYRFLRSVYFIRKKENENIIIIIMYL